MEKRFSSEAIKQNSPKLGQVKENRFRDIKMKGRLSEGNLGVLATHIYFSNKI